MDRHWKLDGIDPEQWCGFRIHCLFTRNGDAYAVKLINLRSAPLLNLKVSVSATIFDEDGRMDFFKVNSIELSKIDPFASIEKPKTRPLEGATYDVDCEYSDGQGNAFHERFIFDIDYECLREKVSSLTWRSMHIFTQFGQPVGRSVWNPYKNVNDGRTKASKKPRVDMSFILVLGPDTGPYLARLKEIRRTISFLGYNSILIRDQKEYGHEALEQKLLRIAMATRFSIVEDSTAAGHIDELSLIARSRSIVAIVREQGKAGTWMQSDYDLDFQIQYFEYSVVIDDDLYRAVARAVDWAEEQLRNRRELLGKRYPWRSKGLSTKRQTNP